MGFLDRLFGRHGSQYEVEAVLYERPRRNPQTDPRPWDGQTSVSVAGESFYQEALVRVCGRQGSEEVRIEDLELELVCDPDNPHDHLAVRVEIGGEMVGHLSRGNARMYHKRIQREGGRVALTGFVGCQEDGPIGVRVHIPDDHPISKPLT